MEVENEAIEQTTEQQTEANVSSTEASESLAAGFNNVRGQPPAEDPPKREDEPVEEDRAEKPDAQSVAAEPEKVESPIVFAGLTEEQLKERLAKVDQLDAVRSEHEAYNQKVFGKFGEVHRELKKLQAAAPAQAVKVTADKLKRLRAEFGDELANVFAEDLNEILQAQAPVAEAKPEVTPDPAGVEQVINTRLEEDRKRYEKRLVAIEHPDCKTVWKSPEWNQWMQRLPPQVQEALGASWDSEFLSQALSTFKADKAKAEKAAQEAATKQTTQQRNDKRLANATAPSGTPSTTPATRPDHKGLSDGFNKVRSKF